MKVSKEILKNGIMKRGFLMGLAFMVMTLGLGSCKSHKKVKGEEHAYVGEMVDRGKKKDNKKDKERREIGEKIAKESMTWLGTPYGYGKSEKGVATDCSGMVLAVYLHVAEVKLPRISWEQAEYCKELKAKEVEAGDLVFFATGKDKKKISHVGVMVDGEHFVHSSASKGVIMSEISTPYYQRTFIMYGRAL